MKPSIVGRVAHYFGTRATIGRYLVELGEPDVGTFETLDQVRERYREALARSCGDDEEEEGE